MKKDKPDGESVSLKMEEKNEDFTGAMVDGMAGDQICIVGDEKLRLDKTEAYCGLKKEELLKYAKDPYWVRLRIILLVIFGVIWLAMLVAAIVIIVLTPKCPPRPNQEWWETAAMYCVQSKSFLDTDGDGIGDIAGVHSKLNYIKDNLKVDAINLGVIQQSPGKTPLGHDVSDFSTIDAALGSQKDFEDLVTAVHKKGMKLILDFVPNHSSNEHPWFKASRNRSAPYADFYIWHPGTSSTEPPNDLKNVVGASAWTFDETRKEFYFHSYSSHEPDLNLTNPAVVAKLDEAILHWLKLKIDGIKVLGGSYLIKNDSVLEPNADPNSSYSEPDTVKLIDHWRQLLDNYTNSDVKRSQPQIRTLMLDMDVLPANQSAFFGHRGSGDASFGPHFIVNKQLLKLDGHCKAECLKAAVKKWFSSIGKTSRHSNWMLSDAGSSRVASRMGDRDLLNAANLLLLTLPGAAFVYYGDEIGMKDATYAVNSTDVANWTRVSFGTMQWLDQDHGGFSKGTPWMPSVDDYHTVNVESQLAHGSGMSTLKVFSKLIGLRKEPSVQWGMFTATQLKNIYTFVRRAEGHPCVLVAVNLGPTSSTVALKNSNLSEDMAHAKKATILASTYNFQGERAGLFSDGTEVDLDTAILLHPGEGLVLKWHEGKSLF